MIKATLTTACALSDGELDKITARFTEILGDTPDFTVLLDPLLIGGICVECEGVRYDGSVKARLGGMLRTMLSPEE